ncbi:MAG: HAD family hydrolase [Desulfovibrionaceae bacterium]
MRPTPFRALVFDFDGTLASLCIDFDAMRDHVAAIAARYVPAAPPPGRQPVLEWMETLAGLMRTPNGNGDAPRAFRSECAAMIRGMEVAAARHSGLFTYTRPVLRALEARGVRVGIITRNCAAAVREVFPDAHALCGCVLTRDDTLRVKPHPDHLRQALHLLGVAPTQALMVGDHPMDIRTGRNALTATAGVASGRTSTLALMRAGADIVSRDCLDLVEKLDRCGLLPSARRTHRNGARPDAWPAPAQPAPPRR